MFEMDRWIWFIDLLANCTLRFGWLLWVLIGKYYWLGIFGCKILSRQEFRSSTSLKAMNQLLIVDILLYTPQVNNNSHCSAKCWIQQYSTKLNSALIIKMHCSKLGSFIHCCYMLYNITVKLEDSLTFIPCFLPSSCFLHIILHSFSFLLLQIIYYI